MMGKIYFIGIFWILLGILGIYSRNYNANGISVIILSIDIFLSSTFSIFSIVIGIFFILRKKWAIKTMPYLSAVLILGIYVLGIKMIINGILDITKFQSLASSIKLIFGFIIITSSIPFFLVIAYVKSKELREIFNCKK